MLYKYIHLYFYIISTLITHSFCWSFPPHAIIPKSDSTYTSTPPRPAPIQQYVIAGIRITVHGLDRVFDNAQKRQQQQEQQDPNSNSNSNPNSDDYRPLKVVCLWLFHSRFSNGDYMSPFADSFVRSVYEALGTENGTGSGSDRQFIAITFDARNHGSRQVDPGANRSWLEGNNRHAQDMYSVYEGTAQDTSLLIKHIESYIFPIDNSGKPNAHIDSHLAFGFSLGGHTAWHLALHEPAIQGAMIVVGSPDYKRLMWDRAINSNRGVSTTENFFPSPDFPLALVEEVNRTDPMQVLFESPSSPSPPLSYNSDEQQQQRLEKERGRILKFLGGKRLLVMAGENDKLVPYKVCVEPFLRRIDRALPESGRGDSSSVDIDTRVYPNTGHEMSRQMLADSTDFLVRYVVQKAKVRPRL